MRRYPEWATYVGDNRYGDKLFDATREGEAADYARARRELAAAKAVARDRLAPGDQVSLDIFIYEREQQLADGALRRLSPPLARLAGRLPDRAVRALSRQSGRDAARRRADPGALGRVSAPRRPGDRLPARRHGARLGAAAHGARPRPRAARPAAGRRRPTGARSSSRSAGSAATSPRPSERPAGTGAAQHRRRRVAGGAPAARLRRRRVSAQGAGRRRARGLPRRRRRLRRAGPRGDDDRPDAGADPRDRVARGRAPAAARWTRCAARSASRATSPPSSAT